MSEERAERSRPPATSLPAAPIPPELTGHERISKERVSSLTMKLAGRYDFGIEVGAGPQSIVYRAIDKKTNDTVAIKIVDLPENETVARALEAEAHLAAGVDHPLVGRMVAFESDQEDAYFISLFVEGESLHDLVRREGPLPFDRIRTVGQDLAEAVAAVHGLWLLHRNVKSSNVILRPDGGAVLTDLGVGRPTGAPGRLSLASAPQYSAPEVFEGFADQRSDVFGIGACLYEAITGRLPPMGYVQHPDGLGPDPREARTDTPEDLVEIVRTCLARDREKRPDSAAEVCNQLGRPLVLPGQERALVSVGRRVLLWLFIVGAVGGVSAVLLWRYANWYPEIFGKVLPWVR